MISVASSSVPAMTSSHQPAMSGLSQPEMAPAHTFGPARPVHFGVKPSVHAALVTPLLHASPVEGHTTVVPVGTDRAERLPDRPAALDTRG